MERFDTIVLGMGASGTAAASTLAAAGRRVLGLEAQDRIGGRVYTVPFGNGVVELGAEWIHGETPSSVYDLAVKNNVSVVSQSLTFKTYRSDGSLADQELVNELIERCIGHSEYPPNEPEPLGQYVIREITKYINEKKPELLKDEDFVRNFFELMDLIVDNYESSNSWNDVTTASNYETLDGDQHLSWHTHGYRTLFDILLNRYKGGQGYPTLQIKLNKEVTQIDWANETEVQVHCKDGSRYTADNVIVTFSLGVLKERHSTLFSPKLPEEKKLAIERMSIGLMDKIQFSYTKKWWPDDLSFFIFFWRGEEKRGVPDEDYWTTKIFGASAPKGSDNVLTLWTSGDVAKLVETLPEDVVKRKGTQLLRRFLSKQFSVPEPSACIRSTWHTNPYTRGSYSYDNHLMVQYPGSRSTLGAPLADRSGVLRILFAGEATNLNNFSTVHGAIDTGFREARRLLPSSKL